jgi:hypothetical protein
VILEKKELMIFFSGVVQTQKHQIEDIQKDNSLLL